MRLEEILRGNITDSLHKDVSQAVEINMRSETGRYTVPKGVYSSYGSYLQKETLGIKSLAKDRKTWIV